MDRRTQRLPDQTLFENKIAVGKFDYSWEPNPFDPPYIYVFGNTWYPAEVEPSVTYAVPGATEVKYVHDIVATPWGSMADFEFLYAIELDKFDWTWHPNPNDPPYIYVFGNQWYPAEIMPTLKYHVSGATEIKYMDEIATIAPKYSDHWHVLDTIEEFDYSWRPDPTDPPYIYVFGNQWMPPEVRPALEYHTPDAVERKYMAHPQARRRGNPENFVTHYPVEFDWSWEPEPGSPPYIYVFGNQWWSAEIMPTVEFHVPGATDRKYMDHPCAMLLDSNEHWTSLTDHDYKFDHSWRPDPGDPPYIYVFGNQWHRAEVMPTLQWTHPEANQATPVKYVESPTATLLQIGRAHV